ncbi:MAG: GNAT family N-acetyltransferase [Gammaproteobacteria bacterium]|nr:GNAT family N-acetyltransferase [Gammaproteobacteria bacterium]
MPPAFTTEIITSLSSVIPDEWNALNHEHSPFLRYEFLMALEQHDAVGECYGWLPRFIVMRDNKQQLVGAMPLYEKDNSYGELVFDWAWADAYQRHGLPWYPKLVSAIPYTPATGQRLLSKDNNPEIQQQLIQAALTYCQDNQYSSLHCLFPDSEQLALMQAAGMSGRTDVQYHWHNQDYADFTEFLSTLKNKKRKKIKQERRRIKEQGVEFRVRHGNELSADDWIDVHHFYAMTFAQKSGYATLNQGFWQAVGATMGEQIVIVTAYLDAQAIACAINFRSQDVLYGRHWGCDPVYGWKLSGLHFETCYYQGIEYAIENKLKRFEPGAQGEYKMSRGFSPCITYSAHWISHPEFRDAINQFLEREGRAIEDYQQTLAASSPYKKAE